MKRILASKGKSLRRGPIRVFFKPDSKEVWVAPGTTIGEALASASIPISMPCGGHGRCGKCLVYVKGSVSKRGHEEKSRISSRRRNARLACLARLEGSAEVTIPASSRVSIQRIAARGQRSHPYKFAPGIIKVFMGRKKARQMRTLAEDYSIGIEDIAMNITNPQLMESSLRVDHEWRLGLHANATLVATRGEIMGFEAGDTSSEFYGIAADVGTNTVICSLIDLTTGKELAVTSTVNPQVVHGDDVISRIRFCKTAGGLERLQREIVNLLNGLVGELARRLKINPKRVYMCSVVGNTAMQHIMVGISPVDLGRAPYRASLLTSVETLASRSGVDTHPDCRLLMPPAIGGFVGGDLVALIVSQGLHKRRVPIMAVDLGTNGEIVLAAKGKIAACSTAAGPAFEGERISCGVRAIDGAIEDVKVTKNGLKLKSINGSRPVGLCGSGLIAAVSELLRAGVIECSGRIRTRDEIKREWLRKRVVDGERGREFIIASRPPVRLRQGDVREVQLGKAAICAGINILASAVGVGIEEVRSILVAGSFGSSLRPSSIRGLGILPSQFTGSIKIIGNSAIEGAKIFLTSVQARKEAEEIVQRSQHIELFSRSKFKEEFYSSMTFPTSVLRK
jgi:uncharacterized 2Fe-2S/4Fe-4S cluster protein (DUF4445 family)